MIRRSKTMGKAYATWAIGCLICIGLHRFYLDRPKTGALMLGLALLGLLLAAWGIADAYSSILDGLISETYGPAEIKFNSFWFQLAAASAGTAFLWAFLDLFLIPGMVKETQKRNETKTTGGRNT